MWGRPTCCIWPLRILPVEGYDVRPHVASVVIQLFCNDSEVNGIVITEQTVFTETLCSRTQCDVPSVAIYR